MSYRTIEVEIEQGRVVLPPGERLPDSGRALLTLLAINVERPRQRVTIPILPGTAGNIIDPSKAQLEASLWGDDETA